MKRRKTINLFASLWHFNDTQAAIVFCTRVDSMNLIDSTMPTPIISLMSCYEIVPAYVM